MFTRTHRLTLVVLVGAGWTAAILGKELAAAGYNVFRLNAAPMYGMSPRYGIFDVLAVRPWLISPAMISVATPSMMPMNEKPVLPRASREVAVRQRRRCQITTGEPETVTRSPARTRSTTMISRPRPSMATPGSSITSEYLIDRRAQSFALQELFLEDNDFQLEYFEVVDSESLEKLDQKPNNGKAVLCIAAYLGGIRLIDNMFLFS